jgi:hypothetical protein
MPRVAVSGDTTAMAAVPTAAGSWLAGPVSEVVVPGLTVGGRAMVSQATCTFTFTNSATGATVAVIVQLTASLGAVVVGGMSVLLDGQSIAVQGNELRVGTTPAGPLVIEG